MQTPSDGESGDYGRRRKAIRETYLPDLQTIPGIVAKFVVGHVTDGDIAPASDAEQSRYASSFLTVDAEVCLPLPRSLLSRASAPAGKPHRHAKCVTRSKRGSAAADMHPSHRYLPSAATWYILEWFCAQWIDQKFLVPKHAVAFRLLEVEILAGLRPSLCQNSSASTSTAAAVKTYVAIRERLHSDTRTCGALFRHQP